jgi:hypothetical protein
MSFSGIPDTNDPRNQAIFAWLRGPFLRLAGIEPATSRSGGARSIP